MSRLHISDVHIHNMYVVRTGLPMFLSLAARTVAHVLSAVIRAVQCHPNTIRGGGGGRSGCHTSHSHWGRFRLGQTGHTFSYIRYIKLPLVLSRQ